MTEPTDEPTPACPACHRTAPTWAICDHCRDDVRWRLSDIIELHALASHPSATQPPYGAGDGTGPIGGSHDLPTAVNIDALDLALGEALLVGIDTDTMGLEDWARDWRAWLGHSPHGAATENLGREGVLTSVVRYLLTHWDAIAQATDTGGHPAADEFASDVRRLHTWSMAALRVTRFDRDARMLREPPAYSIPCPGDDGTGTCGHRLDVYPQPLPLDGRPPEPVRLNCPRCGTRWDLERLRLVAQAAGVRVRLTHDEACAWLSTTPRGLAVLVRTGAVVRTGGRYAVAGRDSTTTDKEGLGA